ncbi:MAG: ATP-binding protein [Erysipelotrichaceae bacterium]|nr:ATP-binding protein [Erysipelotrichaceae bacterium]MBO4538058.1 ATP-binding protein [Erysipelotrichaceae bacterium]MBR5049048.1 ATP-binding protein [Erysipelotrichaceae bacterium]
MKTLQTEAKIENLQLVLSFLEEYLEAMDCSPRMTMQLQVALEEMYTNICFYAYVPESGDVLLLLDNRGSVLKIYLIDRGVEFDPTAKEDPDVSLDASQRPIGGLGIYMVKKIVDRMIYRRINGLNVLCLVKDISRENGDGKI